MLIFSILFLLLSNAVTIRRDKSILFSRVANIVSLYSYLITAFIHKLITKYFFNFLTCAYFFFLFFIMKYKLICNNFIIIKKKGKKKEQDKLKNIFLVFFLPFFFPFFYNEIYKLICNNFIINKKKGKKIKQGPGGIFKPFVVYSLITLRNYGIIIALERLILSLHASVSYSLLNVISVVFLAYLTYNGVFIEGELFTLSFEINTYISNIFISYLGFISIINIVSTFIIKGEIFKLNYPKLYNTILILSAIALLILSFSIYINITRISVLILEYLTEEIHAFIIKIMPGEGFDSRSGSQPGGFGEPVGGGGKPPKKPGGGESVKGHYKDKYDEKFSVTEDEYYSPEEEKPLVDNKTNPGEPEQALGGENSLNETKDKNDPKDSGDKDVSGLATHKNESKDKHDNGNNDKDNKEDIYNLEDSDSDEKYLKECDDRKRELIGKLSGASRKDKQNILNEINVLNDIIKDIKD